MLVVDVNVLVYAHRVDVPRHADFLDWLESVRRADEPVALHDIVLAGFVRVVTHPKIFGEPSSGADALSFVRGLRSSPAAVRCVPTERMWSIFEGLVERTDARGNLVPDAYLAAVAIDQGATLVTADRGFARWPGVSWRHPLDAGVS